MADVQVLELALRLRNGEQIQQGLRRVLRWRNLVTGIQHRNAAEARSPGAAPAGDDASPIAPA